jgi:hypothetical protein
MASAIFGNSPAYDDRTNSGHGGVIGGPLGGLFGFFRDGIQGASAGLLSLMGATQLTDGVGGAAILNSPIGALDGIWGSVADGAIAGPVALFGGVGLFLAARRTIARTLGLMLFISFIAAYANGYRLEDMISALSAAIESGAGALEASQLERNV